MTTRRARRSGSGVRTPRAVSRRGGKPKAIGSRKRGRSTGGPALAIIGAGRAGSALAAALARAGWPIVAVASRSIADARRLAKTVRAPVATTDPVRAAASAQAVLLAVPDREIIPLAATLAAAQPAARRVSDSPVVLHTSGASGAGILAPLARAGWATGSLHPLFAFPPPAAPRSPARVPRAGLAGATFAIDGAPRARRLARTLASSLGGRVIELPSNGRAAYHLAACFASNYVVMLVAEAAALIAASLDDGLSVHPADSGRPGRLQSRARAGPRRASRDPEDVSAQGTMRTVAMQGEAQERARSRALASLLPLLRSTIANLDSSGLPGALTGPVARGDATTLARHAQVLRAAPAELRALHRSLVTRTARLAFEAGWLDRRTLTRIARALD